MNTDRIVFEASAIEYTETPKDGQPIDPILYLYKKPRIGVSEKIVTRMIEREFTKDMDDSKVAAFLGRLKIVVTRPFTEG
jgi:hypothetical protein